MDDSTVAAMIVMVIAFALLVSIATWRHMPINWSCCVHKTSRASYSSDAANCEVRKQHSTMSAEQTTAVPPQVMSVSVVLTLCRKKRDTRRAARVGRASEPFLPDIQDAAASAIFSCAIQSLTGTNHVQGILSCCLKVPKTLACARNMFIPQIGLAAVRGHECCSPNFCVFMQAQREQPGLVAVRIDSEWYLFTRDPSSTSRQRNSTGARADSTEKHCYRMDAKLHSNQQPQHLQPQTERPQLSRLLGEARVRNAP